MKLIDKSALVAEIERRIEHYSKLQGNGATEVSRIFGMLVEELTEFLSFIDTIEMKEVDLDKALSDLDKDIKEFVTTEEFENESTTAGHYWVIAKHAFLLGLKVRKGEEE